MRTIIGLCFLTATLAANSVKAQSLFIEEGDPNTIAVTVGGGMMKEAVGGTLTGGFSYRGVFDVGAEFTFAKFTGGMKEELTGLSLMPFLKWGLLNEGKEYPISMAAVFGVNKHMTLGNGPIPGPDGWGVLLGPSIYKRMNLSSSFKMIPEVLVALDMDATRHYSKARDQVSKYTEPYGTDIVYDVRALLKLNMTYASGTQTYIIMPYAGYQGALVAGANIGLLL
jgi:hypothetical protein